MRDSWPYQTENSEDTQTIWEKGLTHVNSKWISVNANSGQDRRLFSVIAHGSDSGKAVDHIRKKKYKDLPVCAIYDDDHDNAQQVIDDIMCYARLDVPEYYIRALICECYWFCNEIIYDVRKSEAKWPRANTLADFLSLYVKGKPDHLASEAYSRLMNLTQTANETMDNHGLDTVGEIFDKLSNISFPSEIEQEWVYNNFFQINLFFRDMVVVEHLQEPAFTTVDFFSNIGGVFGLWGGVSLLTLLEIMTFLSRLLHHLCCREAWCLSLKTFKYEKT